MTTFYAIDSATDGVYGIDSTTGTTTLVGELGLDSDLGGLSAQTDPLTEEQTNFISGIVDSSTDPPGAESLATLSLKTGIATIVGPQSVSDIQAVANINETVYGFSAAQGLGTFNTETGTFTPSFSETTLPVPAIAADIDESADRLFTIGEDNALYSVDPGSGEATLIGETGVNFNGRAGLAYNPEDQQLYVLGDDSDAGDNLYQLDKTTGAASLVGNTGLVETDGLDYVPIVTTTPEPSAPEPSTPDLPDSDSSDKANQIIVKTKPNTTPAEAQALLRKVDGTVEQTTQTLDIQLWEVEGSPEASIDILSDDPNVEYVERNKPVSTTDLFPDDPRFNELYGLNNIGQTGGIADADIDSPEGWQIQTGSSDVVVGVIDTGVDYTHPDMNDNMWTNPGEIPDNGLDDDGNGYVDDVYGYDFFNNDSDPFDDNGHGTHVAGTIAAEGNNGQGVSGVSWDSSIMALKFLDAGGGGFTFDAIRAVEYATMMGADLTNNSWGGGGFSEGLEDAIAAAGEQGQIFVASAGNDSSNTDLSPSYPASYDLDNIVSVAATDASDRLAGFSNFGSTSVDLGAPGVSILSTLPGGGYGFNSGTSMAAPHVSGAASLLLAQDPSLSAAELKESLLAGTDPIASLSGRTATGGRLNAFNSLSELAPPSEIVGTEGDDVLVGTDRRDSIFGLGGDDIIQALGGDDIAAGGDGRDLISAGDGNDTVTGSSDRDDILGGAGDDQISGGDDRDRILGEAGDDTLSGDRGDDIIESGTGDDTATGGQGNDRLFGGPGLDTLMGDTGQDELVGGAGNDRLEGGSGVDTLTGVDPTAASPGTGEIDTLIGGDGPDLFILGDTAQVYYDDGDPLTRGETDQAIIADFNSRQDAIQLKGTAELYSLDFFTSATGTTDGALFFDPGEAARKEWIGTLQNVSSALEIDSSAFQFV